MATDKRGIYKAYFFKDHDPILDAIDRLYELVGTQPGGKKLTLTYVESVSGVRAATLGRWRKRKTKRPNNPTVEAVINGLGAKRTITYNGHTIKVESKRRK